jgi:hypothetical protein
MLVVGDVILLLPSCGLRKPVLPQLPYSYEISKACLVRQSQFLSFVLNSFAFKCLPLQSQARIFSAHTKAADIFVFLTIYSN